MSKVIKNVPGYSLPEIKERYKFFKQLLEAVEEANKTGVVIDNIRIRIGDKLTLRSRYSGRTYTGIVNQFNGSDKVAVPVISYGPTGITFLPSIYQIINHEASNKG